MKQAPFYKLAERVRFYNRVPKLKWQFAVGIDWQRSVTVEAYGYEEACTRAKTLLDHRDDLDSPASWDLFLIEAKVMS